MKLLVLDRGFLDGDAIGRCKTEHRIDVLIPLRKNMDLFSDVVGMGRAEDAQWEEQTLPVPPPPAVPADRPVAVTRREAKRRRTLQAKRPAPPPPTRRWTLHVRGLQTWTSCPVPLDVVLHREVDAAGKEQLWALASTRSYARPAAASEDYELRTTCEERHRQLKCFQDLAKVRSRSFALITNQVVFTLLTYSILQLCLVKKERTELNRKTLPRVREKVLPAAEQVVIFHKQYFAFLSMLEHQELLLTLSETARVKILAKTQQLRRAMFELPGPRRQPP